MNDEPVYIPTGRCSEIKCSFNSTRDGENYKAAYNFEEFLKIMAEEVEVHNE